jgi:transcriptional regulator with XRE-family HTH domain
MNLDFLAQRIREFRKKRGLTLEQLAERSQLTQSVLSKVENSRVTPSLAALSRIAEALGVSLSELVSGIDDKCRVSVVRRDERPVTERGRPDRAFTCYALSASRTGKAVDPVLVQIQPGNRTSQPLPHEGEEFIFVLKGSIEIECGSEHYLLEEGDSVYFESASEHRIFNRSEAVTELLCILAGENRG